MINFETLKIMALIEYHQIQVADLEADLNEGLVKQTVIKDWNGGWNARSFNPSMIEGTVNEVIINGQFKTYQTAMAFHQRRIAELTQKLPSEVDRRFFYEQKDENMCDYFKFGTEPSAEELLAVMLTKRVFKSLKAIPETDIPEVTPLKKGDRIKITGDSILSGMMKLGPVVTGEVFSINSLGKIAGFRCDQTGKIEGIDDGKVEKVS